MPIYEYYCKKCEEILEVLQKFDDPPPVNCEKCRAENSLTKKLSQTSFVLKGGGWYADAYSSKDAKTQAKDDSKTSKKDTTSSGTDDKKTKSSSAESSSAKTSKSD